METTSLPLSVEQIAKRAEAGAAVLARGAVTLAYDLVSDLVDEVKRLNSPGPQCDVTDRLFLTVEEAAEFLRMTTSTIYSWVSQGKIPHSKVGSRVLFEKNALLEFVKNNDGRTKTSAIDSQSQLRMLK